MKLRVVVVSRKAARRLLPSSQTELESRDGCPGKYTRGLGQTGLAFCDDREDITTVMLTALRQLLSKYEVDPSTIGRLEVRRYICLRRGR
jgi:hydroxymethylglutaryl-CoA synthase